MCRRNVRAPAPGRRPNAPWCAGRSRQRCNGPDEEAPLQKLASHSLPGDEALWREEFIDAIGQLDRQTAQQRIDELQAKWREIGKSSALSPDEHVELKELQLLVRR